MDTINQNQPLNNKENGSKQTRIRIKVRMLEMGLTGAEIARMLKVHRNEVNMVINGTASTRWIRKELALILNIPHEELWP